jgi:hypothetical protein
MRWPAPSFEAPAGRLRMRLEKKALEIGNFWMPLAKRRAVYGRTTISPHPEVRRPRAGASKDEGGWLDAPIHEELTVRSAFAPRPDGSSGHEVILH